MSDFRKFCAAFATVFAAIAFLSNHGFLTQKIDPLNLAIFATFNATAFVALFGSKKGNTND